MAQITYTKLGIKPVLDEIINIQLAPEITIEVKQYLPLQKKLEVLSNIINNSVDTNGFYNSAKIDFNISLEMIYAYTNIKFTEKQKEDPLKIYDTFYSSGVMDKILTAIPEKERDWFEKHTYHSISKIYEYRNSVYGILDAISNDYENLNLDVNKLKEQLTEGKGLETLREITTKLG